MFDLCYNTNNFDGPEILWYTGQIYDAHVQCVDEDYGKLYVTKAGFSSGFNYLGTVNNIKEQGPCQGLFSGVPTLPPPFWGCESHGRDSGYASVPAMTAC